MPENNKPASDKEELKSSFQVKLSQLLDEDSEVSVDITVEDDEEKPVPLSVVDADSLECEEGFRDDDCYILRFSAWRTKPLNATPEQADEAEHTHLQIEVSVGPFEGKYTPQIEEGVLGYLAGLIDEVQSPSAATPKKEE